MGYDDKLRMPSKEQALPGRAEKMPVAARHVVLGTGMESFPEGSRLAMFGMGCFWGVERKFWKVPGVIVVRVVYDPKLVSYEDLLKVFWENHDPTQGMRQGNDVGTQYRSGIYAYDAQQRTSAETSKAAYQAKLQEAGYGAITTEIEDAPEFYFAEDYHQQYLAKNPDGYCGVGGTGVTCPIGLSNVG